MMKIINDLMLLIVITWYCLLLVTGECDGGKVLSFSNHFCCYICSFYVACNSSLLCNANLKIISTCKIECKNLNVIKKMT